MMNPIFRIMNANDSINNGNQMNLIQNFNNTNNMMNSMMNNQIIFNSSILNNNNNNLNNIEITEKLEISPDEISNINEVSNMKDLLICPICLNILIDPVQCNQCNKCFCKSCIDHYVDSRIKCPFRCMNPLYFGNKFVNNVLSILKFKCKNKCDKIINYDELIKHYEEDCEKIDFKAKYKELLKKYKELKREKEPNNYNIK